MGLAPSDADVIRGAIKAQLAELMTSTVGKVQKYDALTQTADVLPVMKRPYNIGYDVVDYEELPVIPNVPVRQPRAGGFSIHMPVEVGDHVLLIFTHDDISLWRESGTSAEPEDLRRHSLGSCVALVGMADMTNPLPVTDPLEVAARAVGLVIGKEGSTAQIQWNDDGILFGRASVVPPGTWLPLPAGAKVGIPDSPVALSTPTDAAIAQLKAEIDALNATVAALTVVVTAANSALASHTHVYSPGPSTPIATAGATIATAPGTPSAPGVPGPPPMSVASTLVKAI